MSAIDPDLPRTEKPVPRPHIVLGCLGLAAIFLLWVGLFCFIEQRRRVILESTSTESRNLAIAIEEQVRRTFAGIDQSLHFVQFLVERDGLTAAATSLGRVPSSGAVTTGVAIIDATGRTIGASSADDSLIPSPTDLAFHAEHPDAGLHISRVAMTGAGSWVVRLSRILHHPDGSFAGLAVVTADAERLAELFEPIQVGTAGTITVFGRDGYPRARTPRDPSLYTRNFLQGSTSALLEDAMATVSSVRRGRSALDGVERIFARRSMRDLPLIVSVGRSVDEVLAPVERENQSTIIFGLITSLLIGFIFTKLVMELNRRRRREAELRTKSELLEVTLDSMDQGLMSLDRDFRVQVCNQRALELLDLPAEFVAAKPLLSDIWRYQMESGDFAETDEALRHQVYEWGHARENQVYERERPNGIIIEVRSVGTVDGGAVRTFTDITDRKVAERRIAHLARHDPLTDLPNRRLFGEELERAIGRVDGDGAGPALLCLDLDGFKAVNDTLGHPAGDVLLHEVASRLRDVLAPGDVVARLGGDEFAIIQVGVEQPAGADGLARRIIEIVNEPFDISDQPVRVGTSIGISIAPRDGMDTEKLLKNADLALYRAKTEGRNVHRFFEPEMDERMQARRALELDLREALSRNEFELHYQPVLCLANNTVVGCEALLRWNHPVRGHVPPGEFIPVAEEAQLIGPIGQWVLQEACREAATWPVDLAIAVNLSAAQFRSRALALEVVSALSSSGLAPWRLELEITETVVMESASLDVLHQLHALGVRIALDDFGTGYSSLSYLRQFPFDRIKIDRSFVKEIANDDTAAIVRAIVGLGTRLGAKITAEGIETADQLARVALEGCTEVQGYLIGHPAPAVDFLAHLPGAVAEAA